MSYDLRTYQDQSVYTPWSQIRLLPILSTFLSPAVLQSEVSVCIVATLTLRILEWNIDAVSLEGRSTFSQVPTLHSHQQSLSKSKEDDEASLVYSSPAIVHGCLGRFELDCVPGRSRSRLRLSSSHPGGVRTWSAFKCRHICGFFRQLSILRGLGLCSSPAGMYTSPFPGPSRYLRVLASTSTHSLAGAR